MTTLEELKEMSNTITEKVVNQPNNIDVLDNIETATITKSVSLVPKKHVSFTVSPSDFISLGGLNIPKQTLYLIVALMIIGYFIWRNTTQNKKEEKDDE